MAISIAHWCILKDMSLFVNQKNSRSELQENIAAELREKMKRSAEKNGNTFDGVEDIKYLEHTKQTTSLAWAWGVIVLIAAGIIVMFLVQGG